MRPTTQPRTRDERPEGGVWVVPAADPSLSIILREQFRLERLRATRGLLLTVVAMHGVFVWSAAVWPRLPYAWGAIATWPVGFAGFLLAGTLELRTEWRLRTLLEAGTAQEAAGAGDDGGAGAAGRSTRGRLSNGAQREVDERYPARS